MNRSALRGTFFLIHAFLPLPPTYSCPDPWQNHLLALHVVPSYLLDVRAAWELANRVGGLTRGPDPAWEGAQSSFYPLVLPPQYCSLIYLRGHALGQECPHPLSSVCSELCYHCLTKASTPHFFFPSKPPDPLWTGSPPGRRAEGGSRRQGRHVNRT